VTETNQHHDLSRFLKTQEQAYPRALAELRAGDKRSHWMWYIFPQIAGLGRSAMAQLYAIGDLGEAGAYLAHPVLGMRLRDCTAAVLVHAGARSAETIFGGIDSIKLRSSMTLFEAAGGGDLFARVIDDFYDGMRDPETLRLLL
jgi:uncharacterized protein (DUF1810 family)